MRIEHNHENQRLERTDANPELKLKLAIIELILQRENKLFSKNQQARVSRYWPFIVRDHPISRQNELLINNIKILVTEETITVNIESAIKIVNGGSFYKEFLIKGAGNEHMYYDAEKSLQNDIKERVRNIFPSFRNIEVKT